MSDIEKIRKINEMSATLKKHGFAMTSDDAANAAQEVYKEKIADVQNVQKPQPNEVKKSGNSGDSNGADEKMAEGKDIAKIERNFEMFKASTHQQIESLKEDVHNVVGKLNEMIKIINELEKLKDDVTTINDGDEKQKRLAPKVVKKPKEEKNQRVGDLKPGDINLSETFYYGKR